MKQPKLYVPGYWVRYTDKTIDFKPFNYWSGAKKQVKTYLKLICADGRQPEFILNRPILWARLGMRLEKDVRKTSPVEVPDQLLLDVLRGMSA